jgi:YbbR domain-containing protein
VERALVWLRNAVITAGLIARQAAVSLRYNWGIGLVSLVLALSLWVYVTDRENPERTGWVAGAVPIEVVNAPADKAVYPPLDESVTVRVRASESVLERLTAEDFRATVDLSDVTSDEATVKVRVESKEPRAVVVDVSPSEVTVTLENVTSRTVPVRTQLVGAPPRGYEARETAVEPEEAVVSGPESLVGRVEAAEADVNLTLVRTDFEQTLLLQARDERGGNIQGVNVEPESAVVRVEIEQLEFSATFIVRPDVSGLPADGYDVISVQVDPPLIVISGSLEVLQRIDAVQGILTEAVSIEGASADVVRTVALRLPQGASVEQPGVTVRITIAPAQGAFSFSVPLRLTNVPSGLSPTVEERTVQVVVAGTVPDLSAIDIEQIVATLDLDGLEAGEHVVPVRVQAPSGTTVGSVTPAEVRVTLRSR